MPNVNVYIRVGDMEAWKALPNKTLAIHNMLHGDKPEFDRSAYLTQQREERARTGNYNRRPAEGGVINPGPSPVIVGDTPGAPDHVVAPPPYKHTFTATAPAPPNVVAKLPKEIQGAFVSADSIKRDPKPKEEQPCCQDPTPCRHWVWDINSGDGYVNSISGRKKVTE